MPRASESGVGGAGAHVTRRGQSSAETAGARWWRRAGPLGGRRRRAAAMGLGASAEQPAGGAEGFHLHGVSRPRGAGDLGWAPARKRRDAYRRPEVGSGGVSAPEGPPGGVGGGGGGMCLLPGGSLLREAAPRPSGPRPVCGRGRPGAGPGPECQPSRKRERFLVPEWHFARMKIAPGSAGRHLCT